MRSNSKLKSTRSSDFKRLIKQSTVTKDGEIASKTLSFLDAEKILEESAYDGLYGICTNFDDSPRDIIKANHRRWGIEESLVENFTAYEIIATLKDFNFEKISVEGYRPLYARNQLTDALHNAFDFRTDYQINTNAMMKKYF